ncbi:MAG: transporter substrate-binding domain-containing protein [Anaerolineales bacterium]|nr:transporter substrate-binding domain-containing protein [Anaerolineales bacterium]
MKKYALLSFLVLASLVLAACGGGETPAPSTGGQACPTSEVVIPTCPTPQPASVTDLGGRTVTVAVENAYQPFNFIDEATGNPSGWDYDAVAQICGILNCVPEFRQAAWEGIFPAMAAGEYDMLADGVTRLYERELIVEFSIPYVTIGQVVLIRADSKIQDLEAFKADPDVIVGTQIGTTNELVALENFPRDRVQSFEDFGGATLALMAGDVDGVVIDNVSAIGYMNANPDMLNVGAQLTSDEHLAFAFPPGSPLVMPFNAALRQMQADGTLQALNDRWFNPQ